MGIIIPAILPKSKEDLEEKLDTLTGLCDEVQIDIVDGQFASPASWPYSSSPGEPSKMLAQGELLPRCGEFRFEVDLMSLDPESVTGVWIGLCATRITIHAESTRFLPRFLQNIKGLYGHDKDFAPDLLSIGLSIGVESDLALIEPYLDSVEYVQFMGIKSIGKQGQPFDSRVIPKISAFKKRYPDIPVQVDGGVTLTTAPALLEAGVSRLIVGSAIWHAENIAEELEKLNELTVRHGLYT